MIKEIDFYTSKGAYFAVNSIEISIQDILWSLKKYIVWIIMATLIGALAAYCMTRFFSTPVYSTKVSFCAFAKSHSETGEADNSELVANNTIANTYAILLTSEPVTTAVSEKLGGLVSPGAVAGMITTSRPNNTQIINVTLKGSDPQLIMDVGNALLEVAPSEMSGIMGAGEMTPVNSARSATKISPNMSTNITYGILIGLLLSCAIVVVIAMLDTTIWREEDLERAFDIPVLGSVPSMFTHEQPRVQKSRR